MAGHGEEIPMEHGGERWDGRETGLAADAGPDSLDEEMVQYGDMWDEGGPALEDAQRESMRIMKGRFQQREDVKSRMERTRRRAGMEKQFHRRQQESVWRQRTKRSPFVVDLVAEDERINEENQLRRNRERREQRRRAQRRERVKNDIILKALSEASDLEALREEKRTILLQEKRLKALLDLEKSQLKRKEDMLAAQRAERKRREAFLKYRRQEREEEEQEKHEERRAMLQDKHELPPEPRAADGRRQFEMRVGRGVTGSLGGRCG